VHGEPLKGHLDTMILATLRDGPAHGYAIVGLLEERSRGAFALAEGTIYPALRRLERNGLLESEWTTAAGRKRRVYRLSAAGRRTLAERTGEWNAFARGMDSLLEGG
jgi:DNA-binding PadR family transcriptional regulator